MLDRYLWTPTEMEFCHKSKKKLTLNLNRTEAQTVQEMNNNSQNGKIDPTLSKKNP